MDAETSIRAGTECTESCLCRGCHLSVFQPPLRSESD
jgi:hypothetical protein